ncbi:hypothetical protein QU593_10135 [Rossellomorea marisflavi]|uniref:hypothetical protein n=1 Tax=Rossellomorea marisflavi TaxID=189381 RepID=UPI0025AFDEB3|nr:hypothetical protein [Rossellomorea marisflavi]WJV20763.1 hypothetical protein QU593_10135 [Rossellomorea marisflavi]
MDDNLIISKLKEENEQLRVSLEQSKAANRRIKKDCKYVDYGKLLNRFNRQRELYLKFENALKSITLIDDHSISSGFEMKEIALNTLNSKDI